MGRRTSKSRSITKGPEATATDEPTGLASLAVLSLVAGAAAGLLGALFRRSLVLADEWRTAFIDRMHGHEYLGLAAVVALAAVATALAAWLVRRFAPDASGSGIP